MNEVTMPPLSPPATRDEMDAITSELRESLSKDRDERIGHFIRLETKIDARLTEILAQLSSFLEKHSDLNARVKGLEKENESGKKAICDLTSKADRNWGVLLTLGISFFLGLVTLLGAALLNKVTAK